MPPLSTQSAIGNIALVGATGAAVLCLGLLRPGIPPRAAASTPRVEVLPVVPSTSAAGGQVIRTPSLGPTASAGRVVSVPLASLQPSEEAAAQPLTGSPEELRRLLLWAEADPGTATAWADERPDAAARREALQAVCLKIAEKDPRGALAMAEAFGFDDEPGVVENLIAQWSETDPGGALGWATNRAPGKARDAAFARVAFAMSASDPVAAARLISENMTDAAAQADAVASVISLWSQQDKVAATAWAQALPAAPLRDRVWDELATGERAMAVPEDDPQLPGSADLASLSDSP